VAAAVKETFWDRLAHRLWVILGTRERDETAEEETLRRQLALAREERDDAIRREKALDLVRAEQEAQMKVNKVTIQHMGLEIERLRRAIEAGIALENRRVAESTLATARLTVGNGG
jgi:hypothetical protein